MDASVCWAVCICELAFFSLMPVALAWNDALESLQPRPMKQGADWDSCEVWAAYIWQEIHKRGNQCM